MSQPRVAGPGRRGGVRVKVPATSANLGPGFDTLGLALDLYDTVDVRAEFDASADLLVSVDVAGEGADEVPRDETHLVLRAMRALFDQVGAKPSRIDLTCHNVIPHGRGLGSSSAAIVAGVLAARALSGADLADDVLLDLASRLEGHPDNVAPCLLGGFTIAWTGDDGVSRAVRLDAHPDITPVACVPATPLATTAARGLLPDTVPHADAARNAGRAALLVQALTRRPDLLLEATEDRLHQAFRQPAMPESIALVESLRRHGLPAVVSGAGPTVVVLTRGDEASHVHALAPGWDVRALPVQPQGASLQSG